VDQVFKALADPSRRKLLDQLHARNGQTLGELCRHLDMSRQAVTKHLALLGRADLVVPLWHGRRKLHYLNPAPLKLLIARWMDKYQQRLLLALDELELGLEKTQK
jgi:DNA-binding transcriptional ArsR family regulator